MKQLRLKLLAASISSITALAQANDSVWLDNMVISASGVEQKIVDAPASITVISQKELKSKPYMTLLDAVRDVEGVDVGETTDKTGQGGISIRGMGADYTLVLIDGRRQNNVGDLYPNNFGGNQFNHIPPLDTIERVEVIRGPMSTLYGADALGGVINIITKKITNEWTGSLTQSQTFETNDDFGNDSTTDFSLSGPLIENRLGVSLRGSFYNRDESSPEYASVTDPSGTIHNRSLGFGSGGRTVDNENSNLGIKFNYRVDERQDITFDYETSEQVYDNTPRADGSYPLGTKDEVNSITRVSGGVVQPRVGYAADQEFTRDQFSLRHEGRWRLGNSDISVHHVETNNNGRTLPFTVQERQRLQQMYDNNGSSWNGIRDQVESTFLPRPKRIMETRQTTYDAKFDTLLGDHLVVFGGQFIDAEMEDGVFGMNGNGFQAGTVQPHKQWALFVEDNWEMTQDLSLTGGVRYDKHDVFGSNVSPRLYSVWQANPDWTIKGGVSTGYKTPKTSDLFPGITGFGGQGTRPFVGTPDLQPETSVNTELAVYYTHQEGHNFNATVFSNQFKDKIARGDNVPNCETSSVAGCVDIGAGWADLGFTSFSQKQNIDRASVKGIELAGRYWINSAWSIKGNYTFTDSEQKSGNQAGQPLTGTAKHMLNTTLDWKVNSDLNVYLSMEARSKRYRSWDEDADAALYYKDYEIFHLGSSYRVNNHLTLQARVNNLLDEDFTSYQTSFTQNTDGTYTPTYNDDYNVKAKARSIWLSANLSF